MVYMIAQAIIGVVGGLFIALRTKKAENVVYGKLDKAGCITNIVLLLIYALLSPFYLLVGAFSYPAYEGFLGIIGWIVTLIIESAMMFCCLGIGLSVAWRKKGKSKESFMVQFAGLAGIALAVGMFFIFYGNLLDTIN